MFYPVAVVFIASGVMAWMILLVIPRFKEVFSGMTGGQALLAITTLILNIGDIAQHNETIVAIAMTAII
jgi:type II secretory pathway component PulF